MCPRCTAFLVLGLFLFDYRPDHCSILHFGEYDRVQEQYLRSPGVPMQYEKALPDIVHVFFSTSYCTDSEKK